MDFLGLVVIAIKFKSGLKAADYGHSHLDIITAFSKQNYIFQLQSPTANIGCFDFMPDKASIAVGNHASSF